MAEANHRQRWKSGTGSGRRQEGRYYSVPEGKRDWGFDFFTQNGAGDQAVPFRENRTANFVELPEEKKQEEIQKYPVTGSAFAKKVLTTGECDLLIGRSAGTGGEGYSGR